MNQPRVLTNIVLYVVSVLISWSAILNSEATHFRSATVSWVAESTDPVVVRFSALIGLRRSGFSGSGADGRPIVGDTLTDHIGDTTFLFGDGSSVSPLLRVTEYNAVEDWIVCEVVDPVSGTAGLLHGYSGDGPFPAGISAGDRIGDLYNRANQPYTVLAPIRADLIRSRTILASPRIVMRPFELVCNGVYSVNASGGQGARLLRYRISTDFEAVGGSAPNQRTSDPITGSPENANFLHEYRNVLAFPESLGTEKYWTIQVVVEAMADQVTVLSSSAADFIVKLGPPKAPANLTVSPGNGQTIITWDHSISATSYRIDRTTTLGSDGIPTGFQTIQSVTDNSFTDVGTVNGTIYYYRVAAINACGERSSIAPQPPLPTAPVNLIATPGNQSITLSWGAAFGFVNTYRIERSLDGVNWGEIGSVAANTLTFLDTALVNGTPYSYRVRARNAAGGNGPYSNVATTAPVAPPPVPTGVTARNTVGCVFLVWNNIANPTGVRYNVKRANTAAGPFTQLGVAFNPAYNDCTAIPGVTYHYVVSSVIYNSESANSTVVNGMALLPMPAVPSGVVAQAGNHEVTLTWNVSVDATSYKVKRSTTPGGPYTTIATLAETRFIDSTAVNGTTYYYVVSAGNSDWESANSGQVSALPAAPVPAPPGNLSATPGNQQITLSWSMSVTATSYKVKRATTPGGAYTTIATTANTSFTDAALVNGVTYYYVVSAVNGYGESAPSSGVEATPYPPLALGSPGFSSSTYQFVFQGGPSGTTVQIDASDDLITWTSVGTPTLTGAPQTFTDSSAGTRNQRFYRAKTGTEYAGGVGFYRVTVPGRNAQNGGGYAAVANQLANPVNNKVSTLFAEVPPGTVVMQWGGSSFLINTFDGSEWVDPDMTVNPGHGVFVRSPNASSFQVTFVGFVNEGPLAINLNGGAWNLVGSRAPQAGSIEFLEYPHSDWDMINQWNETTQEYDQAPTYVEGEGWLPYPRNFRIGEAFFVQPSVNKTWTRDFSVWAQKVRALAYSESTSTLLVRVDGGKAGVSAQVEWSSDLLTWQTLTTVQLGAGGVTFNDTTTGGNPRFYRAKSALGRAYTAGAFYRVGVPGRDASGNGGYALVGNQINGRVNNTVQQLFGNLPSGTLLMKWANNAFVNNTKNGGLWQNPNMLLNPGEGCFLRNPGTTPFNVSFVGYVWDGLPSINLIGGTWNLVTPLVPRAATIESFSYSPEDGDSTLLWSEAAQEYANSPVFLEGDGWIPSPPSFRVGEGFFLQPISSKTWSHRLNVW